MILVCGEALIDLFVQAKPDGSLSAEPVAGGSPYNVAIGLSRLGSRAGYFAGLSKDAFGTLLAGRLDREGVDLALSPRLANPTTLVIVSTDAAGVPSYRFIGEGAADRALTPEDLPAALAASIKAITFGSLSMGVEPTGSTYLRLAERERGARVISVDPNLRASVVGDLAIWRRRQDRFIATANIVKASIEDITGTYGADANVADVAGSWLGLGPSLVVVTRGQEGASAFYSGGTLEVPGNGVNVIDTVGAGDTFRGSFLARILAGDPPDSAARYASVAAALKCTGHGAVGPIPPVSV